MRLATNHVCTGDGDSQSSSLQRFGFDRGDKGDAYEAMTLNHVKRVAAKVLGEKIRDLGGEAGK